MAAYDPREVLLFRQQKAAFFRRDAHAPLQGEAIDNIDYFPPSADFIFTASLKKLSASQRVWLATSTGDSEPYVRYALAVFMREDSNHSLTLYAPEGAHDFERLFLPFTDETSANESYASGRYLEVSPDETSVKLDFNYAYNPYCAYSDRFRCPLPPVENRLTFAVRAGEKMFANAVS